MLTIVWSRFVKWIYQQLYLIHSHSSIFKKVNAGISPVMKLYVLFEFCVVGTYSCVLLFVLFVLLGSYTEVV